MLTYFSITQQGERHIQKNDPCQDYSASERLHVEKFNSDFVIAAVADGVGSCACSQIGSKVAVESIISFLKRGLGESLSEISDASIIQLMQEGYTYALNQVEAEAEKEELPFLELDSTLTAVIYNGSDLWFGHIGDDGVVALYTDGTYEMITKRHKGEEAHSVFPLRNYDMWQFGKAEKSVASLALMTDGVLDYCVDTEIMNNRVYFPFLEPALTEPIVSDEQAEEHRVDWDDYMSGKADYPERFRDSVTDDISFVVVQNSDLVAALPEIGFDSAKWAEDSAKRKKELDEVLYADFRAYQAKQPKKMEASKPEPTEENMPKNEPEAEMVSSFEEPAVKTEQVSSENQDAIGEKVIFDDGDVVITKKISSLNHDQRGNVSKRVVETRTTISVQQNKKMNVHTQKTSSVHQHDVSSDKKDTVDELFEATDAFFRKIWNIGSGFYNKLNQKSTRQNIGHTDHVKQKAVQNGNREPHVSNEDSNDVGNHKK